MITVLENYSIENIFPGEGVRGITSFSRGGGGGSRPILRKFTMSVRVDIKSKLSFQIVSITYI